MKRIRGWSTIGALSLFATTVVILPAAALPESEAAFPAWTFSMKVWPFDILYPSTTQDEIRENLDTARERGANTVIFYIEEEQMYGTFVDETGFSSMLKKIDILIQQAHARGLKAICYLNGLEVMAHDACDNPSVPTLYRNYPDWVQRDIKGNPMVWTCIENDWITEDMEDAWASPYSGFRALFERRIAQLGQKKLDAVYIDQASLPGLQDLGDKWASSDAGFAAAFRSRYGLGLPKSVNWDSVAWRKFVYFRHEAVQEYLSGLTAAVTAAGMAAFFESSSNDTRDGTLLANEPALSVAAGIACSPEIEPEGDYAAAFRMAKFARDISPSQPILYLGWPATSAAARKEFAVAVCQSGNYYPTADSPYPRKTFAFLDRLRSSILDRRRPYCEIALIYSFRNKDWSFRDDETFDYYRTAYEYLIQRHIPFRILPLETMDEFDLAGIGAVVLPGVESLTESELALLKTHPVALVGENGSRDAWYQRRSTPLQFPTRVTLSSLSSALPFSLTAPATTAIEYYTDSEDDERFFLFAFSPVTGGTIVLKAAGPVKATVYEIDRAPRTLTGKTVTIAIRDYIEVIDLVR